MLDLADAVDPATAGGKAAGLAALLRAGFAVPDGIVIPPDGTADPSDVWARIAAPVVAVRSSGVGEDGATASQAGLFDTVLGVAHPDALARAIEVVRASARGPRATATGAGGAAMAVIVQRQVAAVASGVAFTADPVTGSRAVVVIGAVPGTGTALVDGTDGGDEWRVLADRAVPVRQPHALLDSAQAQDVAALARRVARARGGPQDLEWAWDGDDLWLLQSRPMTGLPAAALPPRWWRRRGR